MMYNETISEAIIVLLIVGVAIALFVVILAFISDVMYSNEKFGTDDVMEASYWNDNKSFTTQTKKHTINYTEEQVKKIKESGIKKECDFKVDFNISNTGGSIIKTEVVYVE